MNGSNEIEFRMMKMVGNEFELKRICIQKCDLVHVLRTQARANTQSDSTDDDLVCWFRALAYKKASEQNKKKTRKTIGEQKGRAQRGFTVTFLSFFFSFLFFFFYLECEWKVVAFELAMYQVAGTKVSAQKDEDEEERKKEKG